MLAAEIVTGQRPALNICPFDPQKALSSPRADHVPLG
jgi:hypothetical protein